MSYGRSPPCYCSRPLVKGENGSHPYVQFHQEGSDGLALRFFRQVAKVVDVPWGITVGNDWRLAATKGPDALGTRLLNWYMDRLQLAARSDPEVAWAFLKVANLLAPPSSILHPAIALRVARHALWRGNTQHEHALQKEMVKI